MNKKRTYLELLSDEAFKNWVLHPNTERNLFWETQLKYDDNLREEAKKAREIILRLKFQKSSLQEVEKEEMLLNIISHKNRKERKITVITQQIPTIFSNNLLGKIAAVLVPLFIAAYAFGIFDFNNSPTKSELTQTDYVIKKNPKGRKSRLTLPDGSTLNVNANSELSFAKGFNSQDVRTVHLKGEAFFDVKKMDGKPFKVITDNIEVTVLGTSFNVHSTGTSKYIAVETGKVKVELDNEEVLLLPNEMAVVQKGRLVKINGYNKEKILGWRDGLLFFDNDNFDEIVTKLENWYDVSFEIKGKRKGLVEFSGKYDNKSLAHVLEGLSFAAGFEYRINDKNVLINFN